MKKMFLAVCVIIGLLASANCFACTSFGSACIDGKAKVAGEYFDERSIENVNVGGISSGQASGLFSGCGNPVAGAANAKGILEVGLSQAPGDYYVVYNAAEFDSSSTFFGKGSIAVAGEANQSNWLSLGDDTAYADGWNKSGATYNGSAFGCNPDISGMAVATGRTEGVVKSNFVHIRTSGDSAGSISKPSDPTAYGKGSINAGLLRTGDNFNAYGTVSGNYNYQAAGPRYAQGVGYTEGKVSFSNLWNGISISASTKSGASAKSK